MWTRFWFMISTLWLLFCLHAGSLERGIQGYWLVLGLVGFALWVIGRAYRSSSAASCDAAEEDVKFENGLSGRHPPPTNFRGMEVALRGPGSQPFASRGVWEIRHGGGQVPTQLSATG